MDATLIGSECIDLRVKGEAPGLMWKLDIQNV